MPSSIQYKKIYIDSKFRSPESKSSSDFKIELPETLSFKEDTVFYLDDIQIPHSFESILDNINNKLYFKVYNINLSPNPEWNVLATIEPGNYTPPDLAVEIQTKMNTLIQPLTGVSNMFACSYVVKTNKIIISMTDEFYAFRIITGPELKTTPWTGTTFDINQTISMMFYLI